MTYSPMGGSKSISAISGLLNQCLRVFDELCLDLVRKVGGHVRGEFGVLQDQPLCEVHQSADARVRLRQSRHVSRVAEGYGSSGQVVNTVPVSSSVRVMRAPSALPCSPIQRVNFRRAVSSLPHQPCMTGWSLMVSVRW